MAINSFSLHQSVSKLTDELCRMQQLNSASSLLYLQTYLHTSTCASISNTKEKSHSLVFLYLGLICKMKYHTLQKYINSISFTKSECRAVKKQRLIILLEHKTTDGCALKEAIPLKMNSSGKGGAEKLENGHKLTAISVENQLQSLLFMHLDGNNNKVDPVQKKISCPV